MDPLDLMDLGFDENVAAELTMEEPQDACSETSSVQQPRHWCKEEDELLRAAVDRFGARNWKQIAEYVPGRTYTQCLQRYNKVLKPGLLKGPWSPEEDHLLISLVKQSLDGLRVAPLKSVMSTDSMRTDMMEDSPDSCASLDGIEVSRDTWKQIDWALIAENIPGRSVKQCRERWCSNLDPNIKKGNWSAEEDKVILQMQKREGNCWAKIARMLPGRTEHSVKTRFRSIQRAKKREWSEEEDSILIQQYKLHGSQWGLVAEPFNGQRTKNAVMNRFKHLQTLGKIQASRRPRKQTNARANTNLGNPQLARAGPLLLEDLLANYLRNKALSRTAQLSNGPVPDMMLSSSIFCGPQHKSLGDQSQQHQSMYKFTNSQDVANHEMQGALNMLIDQAIATDDLFAMNGNNNNNSMVDIGESNTINNFNSGAPPPPPVGTSGFSFGNDCPLPLTTPPSSPTPTPPNQQPERKSRLRTFDSISSISSRASSSSRGQVLFRCTKRSHSNCSIPAAAPENDGALSLLDLDKPIVHAPSDKKRRIAYPSALVN